MKHKTHFTGIILLCISIMKTNSHPTYNNQIIDNRVLTEYSDDVQNYLKQFGYLIDDFSKSSKDFSSKLIETGNLRSEEQLKNAIRKLQEFGGIPQTGIVDEKTRMILKSPRCGVADFDNDNSIKRFKRFVVHEGLKWSHHNITWSLVNQTFEHLDKNQVRRIFHEALNVWSKHSKLNFREISSSEADIQVMFAKQKHGDGYDFDGPGNVLAHAFYPGTLRGGDAHFDEEEPWHLDDRTIESHRTSLKNVAIHEFGHSLGLGHSSVQGAVMFPWYFGFRDGDLPEDDRLAIQSLYGVRDGSKQWGPNPRRHHFTQPTTKITTTTTTWRTPRRYNTNRRVDVTRRTYLDYSTRIPHKPRYYPSDVTTTKATSLSTRHYYRHHHHFDNEQPQPQPSKPDTCDTAYDAITIIRGEIFIFKGRYLWRIGNEGLKTGYPHEINKMWRELPRDLTNIDTVYENKKSQIVFFIGNQYYVFHSQSLLPDYPKPLITLGLPKHLAKIDAALVWGYNNRTYFYSGTQYWRFDEDEMQVELDYPRDIKQIWKGISYDIDSAFQHKDGKSYFFKGKGYWQFDDMRMKVAREQQKRSSTRWMGCKPKKVLIDNREVWQNAKLKEEIEDVLNFDDNYDSELEADIGIISSATINFQVKHFKHFLLYIFSFNSLYAKIYLQ